MLRNMDATARIVPAPPLAERLGTDYPEASSDPQGGGVQSVGGVTVLSAAPTSRDVVRVLYRLDGRVRITDVHLTGDDPYLRDVHVSRGIECYGASDLGGEDWHEVVAAAEEVVS
jgi:hypothetical protein